MRASFDGHRRWLDLDATLAEPDVEGHAGSETRFAPDVLGDDQSSGWINGSFHGIEITTAEAGQPCVGTGVSADRSPAHTIPFRARAARSSRVSPSRPQ